MKAIDVTNILFVIFFLGSIIGSNIHCITGLFSLFEGMMVLVVSSFGFVYCINKISKEE